MVNENFEITVEQLKNMSENEYRVIDIRDEISFDYGNIPGSFNIPYNKIKEGDCRLPTDKRLVICCKSGLISDEIAQCLRDKGYSAVNLAGGYYSWLKEKFIDDDYAADVEKSIRKSSAKLYGAALPPPLWNISWYSQMTK